MSDAATITKVGMSTLPAVAVTGAAFGMHYDLLAVGFLAGIVALSFQGAQSYIRMLGSVFSSTVLAGGLSPVWTAVIVHYFPYLESLGVQPLNVSSAIIIGVSAQTLVPVALARMRDIASSVKIGGDQK